MTMANMYYFYCRKCVHTFSLTYQQSPLLNSASTYKKITKVSHKIYTILVRIIRLVLLLVVIL